MRCGCSAISRSFALPIARISLARRPANNDVERIGGRAKPQFLRESGGLQSVMSRGFA